MVSIATQFSRATVEETTGAEQRGGGVVVPSSANWPRTDENALPSCVRIPVDVNGDNLTDHVATLDVRLVDLDGNGRWDRHVDGVFIDPRMVERIDRSVQLHFGETEWKAACKRAIAGL